jgi:DNA invertase Pin-like site-specific DNA recombinase
VRYVAYLRVSTDRQADEGGGLDIQELACRKWAREHKHRIMSICRDEGRSGAADTPDRPGLARALQLLADERADGIVVYRLDRLARDVILQEQLYAEVLALGGQLHSTSPAEDAHLEHDPDDPTRALVRRILGAISDYERQMIRLRMRSGKTRKAAAGGYTGGRPPYGWDARGRELVPNPAEQGVRRRIKDLRRKGHSLRSIAAFLNEEGIPTKAGRPWGPVAVNNVLQQTRRITPPQPSGPVRPGDIVEPENSDEGRLIAAN